MKANDNGVTLTDPRAIFLGGGCRPSPFPPISSRLHYRFTLAWLREGVSR